MKIQLKLFLVLFFCTLNKIGFCQVVPSIVIDGTDRDFSKFDEVNGKAADIDETTIKSDKGFIIKVSKDQKIKFVEAKNNGGQFTKNATRMVHPPEEDEFDYYNFKRIFIDTTTNTATIRLCTDIEGTKGCIDITLNVKKKTPRISTLDADPGCPFDTTHTVLKAVNCDSLKKDYKRFFGEIDSLYDQDRVTYIYDFNNDPAKRTIYKVWEKKCYKLFKIKPVKLFKIKPVNFSRETLKSNQYVQFKIVNINKFLYDVSTTDSIASFQSEPSALFNRLFIGDDNLLGKLMTSFGTGISAENSAGVDADDLERLKNLVRCFSKKYNGLQARMLQAYNPCSIFPCCSGVDEPHFHELANDLSEIKFRMSEVFGTVLEQKKTALKTKNDRQEECKKITADLEAGEKQKKDIETNTKDSDEKKSTLKSLTDKIDKLTKAKCPENEIATLKTDISTLESDIKSLTNLSDLQSQLPSMDELRKLVTFINNMVQLNSTHVVGPIALTGNRLDLTINIKSKDSITKYFSIPEYNNQPLHYEIPVIGRVFVSFSSGSFVATPNRLKNKTYEWESIPDPTNTVTDTTRKILAETGYTQSPLGFAALGNLEWKTARSFGLGVSAGVGITIEKDPRPVYLLGGSLFFGDLRQFAITGGVAGMEVKRLNSNFKAIADAGTIYTKEIPIEYYKQFKVGAFLSLTYTPFSIIKKR